MADVNLEEIKEILVAVENLRRQKRITRSQLSENLGIPFNTFRAWFHKKGAKTPSRAYLPKLRGFVQKATQSRTQWDELWKKIREWWHTQHRYSSLEQLAEEVGWTLNDLHACLQNESNPPRLVVERLAQLLQLQTPPGTFPAEEAKRRSERLKALLSIIAEELAWFRDGPVEVREVYRSELDQFDAGYVTSLLTMLFAEDKFRRWLEVTTNRFNYFKKGRGPS